MDVVFQKMRLEGTNGMNITSDPFPISIPVHFPSEGNAEKSGQR